MTTESKLPVTTPATLPMTGALVIKRFHRPNRDVARTLCEHGKLLATVLKKFFKALMRTPRNRWRKGKHTRNIVILDFEVLLFSFHMLLDLVRPEAKSHTRLMSQSGANVKAYFECSGPFTAVKFILFRR